MKERVVRLLLMFVGVGLLHQGQLGAEPPSWDQLRYSPILMRQHLVQIADYGGSSTPYQSTDGIWRLGPDGQNLSVLRRFTATNVRPGSTGSLFAGDQGFLTIRGDRVLFQANPYDIHFDAFSWKMVNRLPVADGERSGWALQGPFIAEQTAAVAGLQSGVYGIARCVYSVMFDSYLSGKLPCSIITVPGTTEPTDATEEQVLLYERDSPGLVERATPVFRFSDASWDGDRVLLSIDPQRHAFWRGSELRALRYPIVDGQLAAPDVNLDLNAMPFGLEPDNGYLSALHFHEPRSLLFGVLHRRPNTATVRPSLLFSVDPLTGEATEIAGSFDESYPPFTFSSFGAYPATYEQMIPIVADTGGATGGRWRSDLWLFNPSDDLSLVTVNRLSKSEETIEFVLQPHGSLKIDDILVALGGGRSGDGRTHDALFLSSEYRWAEQVVAVGRIWMRDSGSGGTYGHSVPAVPAPYGYSNHSVNMLRSSDPDAPRFNVGANARAAHIDLDRRDPMRYRHNIGIVNPSDEEVVIQLAWTFQDRHASFESYGPDAEGFRRTSIVVPPRGLEVRNIESLFPLEVVEGWVPRLAVFGVRPAAVWYSMVDNLTGDATFVPFTSFAANQASQNTPDNLQALTEYRFAIPVVASTSGRAGSVWKTDLYGFVDGEGTHSDPAVVSAFHPSRPELCVSPSGGEINGVLRGVLGMPVDRWLQTIDWPSHVPPPYGYADAFGTIYPDVVHSFSECAEATNVTGGLEILAGSWFSGFSRTYTTRTDGGTYGGMLPLYPQWGWPVQHFAGLQVDDGFRINVGFFNGNHDHAIEHRVVLYAEDGQMVAQRTLTFEPLASLQKELLRLFRLDELPDGTYGLTVLPLDDPVTGVQGRSWAYVSIVDNLTNDPTNLW